MAFPHTAIYIYIYIYIYIHIQCCTSTPFLLHMYMSHAHIPIHTYRDFKVLGCLFLLRIHVSIRAECLQIYSTACNFPSVDDGTGVRIVILRCTKLCVYVCYGHVYTSRPAIFLFCSRLDRCPCRNLAMHSNVCMFAYKVLVWICMYGCMYVCMYVWSVCMYGCMYACMYVYMYVCMYVCMYVRMYVWSVCMYGCMYVCMYACMYCMYVYVYVCTCICTYAYTPLMSSSHQQHPADIHLFAYHILAHARMLALHLLFINGTNFVSTFHPGSGPFVYTALQGPPPRILPSKLHGSLLSLQRIVYQFDDTYMWLSLENVKLCMCVWVHHVSWSESFSPTSFNHVEIHLSIMRARKVTVYVCMFVIVRF